MSVKTSMTALADQVRRLASSTNTMTIDQMTTALSGVTAGGSGTSTGDVSLANVEVFVADYYDSTSVTTTAGVVDVYKRIIAS